MRRLSWQTRIVFPAALAATVLSVVVFAVLFAIGSGKLLHPLTAPQATAILGLVSGFFWLLAALLPVWKPSDTVMPGFVNSIAAGATVGAVLYSYPS
ncbi:MAG: hypothetical protein K5Q68_14590 [Roseococcus sp.]|nr:hypothetical protein [Roseococcus sp.]